MKMIKLISLITCIALIYGCENGNNKFTGYIVAKEFTPEHMSDKQAQTISVAGVFVNPIIVHHQPAPNKIDDKYVWFVADKYKIFKKEVTKDVFNSKKCGDKVIIDVDCCY